MPPKKEISLVSTPPPAHELYIIHNTTWMNLCSVYNTTAKDNCGVQSTACSWSLYSVTISPAYIAQVLYCIHNTVPPVQDLYMSCTCHLHRIFKLSKITPSHVLYSVHNINFAGSLERLLNRLLGILQYSPDLLKYCRTIETCKIRELLMLHIPCPQFHTIQQCHKVTVL